MSDITVITSNYGYVFWSYDGIVKHGRKDATYRVFYGETLTYEQICEMAEAEKNQPQEETGQ